MADSGDDDRFCPPHLRRFVLASAILASSMAFIDGSVLSIAIPALRADLGATLADAQWISNAYALFLGALILFGGAAGDRFGLKRVFGLGIAGFVVASLCCALAPTAPTLIMARALQGIAAAFMVPGSLAIIAKAYPKAERGGAIGLWAAASSLTTILGPIIGGFVLTGFGDWAWRLVFAINLPLGIGAIALLWRVPNDRPSAPVPLDLPGAVLASLGLGLVAFGLTGPGGESGPPLSHIVLYVGAGLLVFAGFLFRQATARAPMMKLSLFTNRAFAGANGLTFVLYFALSGVMFFLPMTMIAGWGASAADVALAFLPFGAILTLLSPIAGRLSDRFGAGILLTIGSLIVALAFFGLGLTAPLRSVWGAVVPLIGLMGVGMGLVVSPLSTAVMTSVADADTGIASGINNAVSRVAGLLAVAILGLVAAGVFERALGPAAELALFFGLPAEPGLDPQTESLRRAATDAAFAAVANVTAVMSLVAAGIAATTLRLGPNAATGSPPR